MRNGMALLLVAALCAPPAWAAPQPLEPPAQLVRLPEPAGLGQLAWPAERDEAPPLVILFPDALGEDKRSEPYVEALLAQGLAVLTLGLGGGSDGSDPAQEPAASPDAVREALAWVVQDGRFLHSRTGLLGFGAGGRAVIHAAPGRPSVALYPGCRGLALPSAGPVLVLHGAEAPDAAHCDMLAPQPGVLVLSVPGVSHGWDVPGEFRAEAGMLIPDPAGEGRLRTSPDPGVTWELAGMIAAHLGHVLAPAREAGR